MCVSLSPPGPSVWGGKLNVTWTVELTPLVGVLIVAAVAFMSIRYGLVALVPVVVGIMINYIFMWAFSIPFDIVTVGFSSVAMGAGIDDAIHFIIRYRLKRKEKSLPVKDALKENMRETGRPIILTSLSVDAGLAMLFFSSFRPIRIFGMLMVLALSAAMIATLCLMPPVLILIDRIRMKMKAAEA